MIISNRTMRLHDHCMRVCGAGLAERVGGALQFKQAMSSGVLQGDEYRALAEFNAYFIGMVAREFDVSVGKLRDLAAEGRLTAERLALILATYSQMIVSDSECVPISYEEIAAKRPRTLEARHRERLIELIGDDQGL